MTYRYTYTRGLQQLLIRRRVAQVDLDSIPSGSLRVYKPSIRLPSRCIISLVSTHFFEGGAVRRSK